MKRRSTARRSFATVDDNLLRGRVQLYVKFLFLIHLAFWGAEVLSIGLELPGLVQASFSRRAPAGVLLGALGLVWWYHAQGHSRRWTLLATDTLVPVLLAAMYVAQVGGTPNGGLVVLLLVSLVLVVRAAVVPSPVSRTVVVGICGVGAALVAQLVSPESQVADLAWLGVLGNAFIAATALTSSVIYGLRREVGAAKRLGQYELGRKLGEGGMGIVYEATHVLLRRRTAVKLLPIEKAGEEAIARFEQEVRHTSQLEHPNTVSIYDYGRTPDGQFYYAMEYLDGLDLDQLVRSRGALNDARSVLLLRQAAQALAEAHGKGLVHRDVKPSNIMVCDRGGVPDTVKVLDFGLVKSVGAAEADDGARTMVITQATVVVGTPHYLAPEAIRQMTIGPPADVYALGAVGFFLLTGREVFPGAAPIEILSNHLTAEPPALSPLVGRAVGDRLESTLRRCLAKNPGDRYQDGHALATALSAIRLEGWGRTKRVNGGQTTGRRSPLAHPMLTTRVRSWLSTYSHAKCGSYTHPPATPREGRCPEGIMCPSSGHHAPESRHPPRAL